MEQGPRCKLFTIWAYGRTRRFHVLGWNWEAMGHAGPSFLPRPSSGQAQAEDSDIPARGTVSLEGSAPAPIRADKPESSPKQRQPASAATLGWIHRDRGRRDGPARPPMQGTHTERSGQPRQAAYCSAIHGLVGMTTSRSSVSGRARCRRAPTRQFLTAHHLPIPNLRHPEPASRRRRTRPSPRRGYPCPTPRGYDTVTIWVRGSGPKKANPAGRSPE